MSTLSLPFLLLLLIWTAVASASIPPQLSWFPAVVKQQCSGSIGIDECISGEAEEFELESESNRRILATNKYISYGALQRNTVPCSRRGASYYNCRPGAASNPYTRGCSSVTRCRK